MNKSDKEKQKLQAFGLLMTIIGIIIFYGAWIQVSAAFARKLITFEMFAGFAIFGLGMAVIGIQIFFKNKK